MVLERMFDTLLEAFVAVEGSFAQTVDVSLLVNFVCLMVFVFCCFLFVFA